MESRNYTRSLLVFVSAALFLLFKWSYRLYSPSPQETSTTVSVTADLLDFSTNTPWRTSKNRFQSQQPSTTTTKSNNNDNIIKKPPKPKTTRFRDQHVHEQDVPHHPLDPLTIQEINKVRSILKSHELFESSSSLVFHSLVLEEPEKSLVLKWRKGSTNSMPPRKAFVVARANGVSYVLTVDIATGEVTQHESSQSGYPMMTIEDMTSSTWAPLANMEFNRTIIARGVDLNDLACLPLSLGWYGKNEENRRLIKVQCFSLEGTANFYMRPIEGLTVLMDIDTKEVVEIRDVGRDIPIPKASNTEYRYSTYLDTNRVIKGLTNPISIEQPKGPSFRIEDEHMVKWANWEFHLKPDPRAGVIISQARVKDQDSGELRNVLYKGLTSELFVPYMDPTDAWYFKTYMDAGEYGFGLQAMPLDPLNDCPRNAYYMDGVFPAGDGSPYVRENMVCVYESYSGDIGWRHTESPITGMGVSFHVHFSLLCYGSRIFDSIFSLHED